MNSAALEINEQRKTFNAIMSVIPLGSSFGKSILLPKTHISTFNYLSLIIYSLSRGFVHWIRTHCFR
jgi:hypothetical protein